MAERTDALDPSDPDLCRVRPGSSCPAAAGQPNILWLSCEDISPHLGCYGDPHAITPNLGRLSSEGIRYTHAFTAAGVCAPCRSAIITGMYQPSIGTHHMHCNAKLPEFVKPFPLYLREAGYFCTNHSKTAYQFSKPSPKGTWDESSASAHWSHRAEGQPFFAVFNFNGCPESGIESKSKYESVTKDLSLDRLIGMDLVFPGHFADTAQPFGSLKGKPEFEPGVQSSSFCFGIFWFG